MYTKDRIAAGALFAAQGPSKSFDTDLCTRTYAELNLPPTTFATDSPAPRPAQGDRVMVIAEHSLST
jgi:hypothetical protein